MTSDIGSVETPWGSLRMVTRAALKGLDGHCTGIFAVDTEVGKARSAFYLEVDRGELPDRLRVLMLCGYGEDGTTKVLAGRESLVSVAGAFVGWRAQAYLDPATGLPDPKRPTSVMLTDGADKPMRGFQATAERVRAEVDATLGLAAEADPGYVARVYAGLMRRMMRDIEDDVVDAENHARASERAAAEARDVRDRARALLTAAEEVEFQGTGPTP